MSTNAEQLADNYARGEIDGVPKCGQGKRTKAEQVYVLIFIKKYFGTNKHFLINFLHGKISAVLLTLLKILSINFQLSSNFYFFES
jgi:hypothetical protein